MTVTAASAAELARWQTLREPDLTAAQLAAHWYPHPNDLVGGWCVMPVDAPPSCGIPPVGDMLGERLARHVAHLHNQHASRPAVSHTPGMRFGRAHIEGRPVEAIGDAVWDGGSVDEIAEQVMLGRADVLVACWWLGTHGTRAWRRRWRKWAESVHLDLAHNRWDVPDPPDRNESDEEAVKPRSRDGIPR